jgi:PAS domain S-box-containing protein
MVTDMPAQLRTAMMPDRRIKILAVDDDRTDRQIYRHCLNESTVARFDLAEAGSAEEAIRLAADMRPDCVLLDYDLPDKDGLEVLAHLRSKCQSCAVVMLTACGGEELAVRAMKAGATDYLPKRNVNPESLAYTVLNAIQKEEMQSRLEEQRVALENSRRRYETLIEAMPQMVWTADAQGDILYANRRWLEYTGIPLDCAKRLGWDQILHADDAEHTCRAWREAAATGSVFEIEHRLRRASDQSYRWHLVRAVPIPHAENGDPHWFGTCTDIEEQKRAERATLEREKLEGLGLLAGGIAHDFNNLLVSILGGASLVRDTLGDDHSRALLDDVVRAGERAADLTRKMLAYAGRGSLFVEPVDVERLTGEVCRLIALSVPANVHLHFQPGPTLPAVYTDAEQLRRIIVELVMNALEAIGQQPGEIWVRTSPSQGDDERPATGGEPVASDRAPFVLIEVRDTGCGMDPGTQARIFDPFFSTKFTGRGLGLSAVKGIVRSHGGKIRVKSSSGQGATFEVLLPTGKRSDRRTAMGGNR